jgi:hypothetical protein
LGRPEVLLANLRRVPVRRGTVVLVPSGTLHSIGPDILLAEIQQPADRTLRLYDWGSERALQVEAALAAVDPGAQPQVWQVGEAPRTLRGAHVELTVLGEGSHALDLSGDALVVPVGARCELESGGARAHSGHAELRLCTGGRLAIDVPAQGMAVVGIVANG